MIFAKKTYQKVVGTQPKFCVWSIIVFFSLLVTFLHKSEKSDKYVKR